MPAAIEFYTWIAVAARDDRRLVVHSTNFPDSIEVDLEADEPSPRNHWTDYVVGVAVILWRGGHPPRGAGPFLCGAGAGGGGRRGLVALASWNGFGPRAGSGPALWR